MRAYSTGARAALAFPKRRGYSRQNSKLAAFRLIQEAAAMALRVMSADSHMDLVYLPPDTCASRMDPRWGDAARDVVERDGRKWWVSRDAVLGPYGVYGPGVTGGKRGRILAEAGFATGKQTRPSHPIERREDQARDGVEAEVIYGIIGISRGLFTHQGISDHEMLTAVYHAYNRYIAEFNQTQPGRYYGLGCLPNHDATLAADELRHCATLGLHGAVLVPWGSARPVWHEMWEPVWSTAEEPGLLAPFPVCERGGAHARYCLTPMRHAP